MTDNEIKSDFPSAARILQRVASDPELSAFLDVLTQMWREDGDRRVAAERERCARIAIEEKVDAESTGMESDFAYNRACDDIAASIRKDRGSDPPQAETK